MRPFVLLVMSALVLSGCVSPPNGDGDGPGSEPDEVPAPAPETHSFEGEFAVASEDAPHTYAFDVPNGTGEVEGLLTWTIAGAQLDFELMDPSGEVVADGWAEGTGRAYVTTTHPPEAGEWQVVVRGVRGADVHYTMEVTTGAAEPYGAIDRTFTVPARNPARDLPDGARQEAYPLLPRDFAEVNLNMAPGDHFNFTWSAHAPVYFNVHYHGANGTERPIEDRTDALNGTFTANLTEVYALLWRNEGSEPVEVVVQVEGVYRLHSMTREE